MNALVARKLEELVLAPFFEDEIPPKPSKRLQFLTPDCRPIPGDIVRQMEVVFLYRMEPENMIHDEVGDGYVLSTVYLGFDHGYSGVPLIWETMVVPNDEYRYRWRYSTRAAAMAGHKTVLSILRGEA